MGREREGHTGQVAQEHGGDPAVSVVPGERIGKVVSVVGLDVGDPIAHQERPQFLLGQERVRIPGREPDDPYVWGVGVDSFGVDEFRPPRVVDTAGEDVDPVPEGSERQRHLLHVHELAPEIGVRRQIAVGRVEVALRIEKGEVHRLSLRAVGSAT